MSIASAISNAQAKVAAAYTALRNKGATMPATQDLANMPTAIASIPSGGGSDVDAYDIMENNMFTMIPGGNFSGGNSGVSYTFKNGHTYRVIVKLRQSISGAVSFNAYKTSSNTPNAMIGIFRSGETIGEFSYTHEEADDYAYFGIYASTSGARNAAYAVSVYIEDIT